MDRALEGIIAYARRSTPSDGPPAPSADARVPVAAEPDMEASPAPSGLFGRALGKLTGR